MINIGKFFLLSSMASIELSEPVYITHLLSSVFNAVISAVWMEASSGSVFLLVMSQILLQNLLSLPYSLIHLSMLPCYFHVSLYVVGSVVSVSMYEELLFNLVHSFFFSGVRCLFLHVGLLLVTF